MADARQLRKGIVDWLIGFIAFCAALATMVRPQQDLRVFLLMTAAAYFAAGAGCALAWCHRPNAPCKWRAGVLRRFCSCALPASHSRLRYTCRYFLQLQSLARLLAAGAAHCCGGGGSWRLAS